MDYEPDIGDGVNGAEGIIVNGEPEEGFIAGALIGGALGGWVGAGIGGMFGYTMSYLIKKREER